MSQSTTPRSFTHEAPRSSCYVPGEPDPEILAASAAFRAANRSYQSSRAAVAALDRHDPARASAEMARSISLDEMLDALKALSLAGVQRTHRQAAEFRAWAGRPL